MNVKALAAVGTALALLTGAPALAAQIVTAGPGEVTALYLTLPSELSTSDATATAAERATFLGAPNNVYTGIGGQWVQYDLGAYRLVNGAGQDFNVYELGSSANTPEFGSIDVLVSGDGVTFYNVESTSGVAINLAGDGTAANAGSRRSYDVSGAVAASGLTAFRYIRIDGAGTAVINGSNGFDLDAVGVASFAAAPTGVVPEPATWAMMIGGFGLVGGALRARRKRALVPA